MTCATGEACGESHAAGKCPWVRVESPAQVHAGDALRWSDVGPDIAIVLKVFHPSVCWPCFDCGVNGPTTELSDDTPEMRASGEVNCVACDSSRGVLFRLVPPDESTADDVQTVRPVKTKRTLAMEGGKR
jgi:hypothetical protein